MSSVRRVVHPSIIGLVKYVISSSVGLLPLHQYRTNRSEDVPCNETCPFCFNVFRYVRPFIRHDCKISRSEPGTIYLQERTASLTRSVHSHLDEQHARPNKRRRLDPATEDPDGSPTPACSIPARAPAEQFTNASNTTGNSLRFDSIPNVGGITTLSQFGEPRHGEASSLAVDGEFAFASVGGEFAFASVGGDLLSLVDTANVGEWAYADPQFPIT